MAEPATRSLLSYAGSGIAAGAGLFALAGTCSMLYPFFSNDIFKSDMKELTSVPDKEARDIVIQQAKRLYSVAFEPSLMDPLWDVFRADGIFEDPFNLVQGKGNIAAGSCLLLPVATSKIQSVDVTHYERSLAISMSVKWTEKLTKKGYSTTIPHIIWIELDDNCKVAKFQDLLYRKRICTWPLAETYRRGVGHFAGWVGRKFLLKVR